MGKRKLDREEGGGWDSLGKVGGIGGGGEMCGIGGGGWDRGRWGGGWVTGHSSLLCLVEKLTLHGWAINFSLLLNKQP